MDKKDDEKFAKDLSKRDQEPKQDFTQPDKEPDGDELTQVQNEEGYSDYRENQRKKLGD